MRFPRITFFRIWYSSTYTILYIILLILLGVSPADTIYQCIRKRRVQNIFVIAGVYVLTALVVLFIYSSRLYTNRTVLTAIPKSYLPIEPGEIAHKVRRIIVKNLRRSAIITWDIRPRDVREELAQEEERLQERPSTAGSASLRGGPPPPPPPPPGNDAPVSVIPLSTAMAAWGPVAHPGWSSPSSDDLPNIHYGNVVSELPNLIEAKAVSLAPPDPLFATGIHGQDGLAALPDARIVAFLQRPAVMGMREYLEHLSYLGLVNPPELRAKFVSQYEYTRFSTHALVKTEFQDLMATFAQVLNGMTELDPAVVEDMLLEEEQQQQRQQQQYDDDEEARMKLSADSSDSGSAIRYRTPHTSGLHDFSTESSVSLASDLDSPITFRTARHQGSEGDLSRTSSDVSGSLRSVIYTSAARNRSLGSFSSSGTSTRSVIRLSSAATPGSLPYQYNLQGS